MELVNLEEMKASIVKGFLLMEGMSPSNEGEGDFEEALWQLQKVADSMSFMKASYEDIICEAKSAMAALDEIGKVIQEKIENPYKQVEFADFALSSRRHHAYL